LYVNFSNPIFLAVGAGATVGFIKTGFEEHIS
jgi:hypothetical protein